MVNCFPSDLFLFMLSRKGVFQVIITSVSSVTQLCPTVWNPVDYSTPGLPVHHQLRSLLKLMPIESVMPPNHLILCCSLLLPPSVFPSIRVFSNESAYICIYKIRALNLPPNHQFKNICSYFIMVIYKGYTKMRLFSFGI